VQREEEILVSLQEWDVDMEKKLQPLRQPYFSLPFEASFVSLKCH